MTLFEIITGDLSYSVRYAVYAKRINGRFTPKSPARLGKVGYENGGVNDDYDYFMNNSIILDLLDTMIVEKPTLNRKEAAEVLIDMVSMY